MPATSAGSRIDRSSAIRDREFPRLKRSVPLFPGAGNVYPAMPPENFARRRFLRSSAVASGLVGVSFAGCTDLMDDAVGGGDPGPDRDRPAYAPYLPAEGLFGDGDGEGSVGGMYVFLDFETLAEYENMDIQGSITTPDEPVEGSRSGDVAFAAGPTLGLLVYVFGMFGLIGYSFTGDLIPSMGDSSESDGDGDFQTRVSLLTSFGYVFLGDYDVESLGETAEGFEAVDEREGVTVFEGQSADDGSGFSMAEGLVFAASSEAVLVPLLDTSGDDSGATDAERNREMVDTMIDVASGTAERAAESDADVDWMLRTTGHGAFGIGTYGENESLTEEAGDGDGFGGGSGGNDSEFFEGETRKAIEDIGALLADAKLYGSGIELTDETDAVGHVAFAYDSSEDVPSDDEFESVFGDVSGEFSLESGETRVYLSATQSLETSGT
jgi:hypothetical protein